MGNRLPTYQPVSVVANRGSGVGRLATISPLEALVARISGRQASQSPATCDLPCHTSDHRERLWSLLDAWAGMDEAAWPEANVKALHDDIMDLFLDHPEADGWFREWRAGHPEARLA